MMARRASRPKPFAGCAAQYLRMSTDRQVYSIESQTIAIAAYAADHGLSIVRTYSDEGRSGLTFEGREGLKALIADVVEKRADFSKLLVYDISRWGRFQDIDAGAYYEYLCRTNGIEIIYCVEPFDNDLSPMGAIAKTLKRIMAAEYSRELSVKCFAGQCRAAERGYHQGAPPCLGVRRMIVDTKGRRVRQLEPGERKSVRNERIILVPGPQHEIDLVRKIFHLFVVDDLNSCEIATIIQNLDVGETSISRWDSQAIRRILRNEKYIGNNTFNRTSTKLKGPRRSNPPSEWITVEGVFEPIVSDELFARAQAKFAVRQLIYEDEAALHKLRELFERHGRLTQGLIQNQPDMPGPRYYTLKFGSLHQAFERVGCTSYRDDTFIRLRKEREHVRPALAAGIAEGLRSMGFEVETTSVDNLIVNGVVGVSINVTRCLKNTDGSPFWSVYWGSGKKSALTVIARLDFDDDQFDYCLVDRRLNTKRQYRLPLNLRSRTGFWVRDSAGEMLESLRREIALTVASQGDA